MPQRTPPLARARGSVHTALTPARLPTPCCVMAASGSVPSVGGGPGSSGQRLGPPPAPPPGVALAAPPTPFPHPYSPYPSQLQFMQCVYTAIVQRKVAILESPTGTGKTLSLLVAALHWLREVQGREDDMDRSAAEEPPSQQGKPPTSPGGTPASAASWPPPALPSSPPPSAPLSGASQPSSPAVPLGGSSGAASPGLPSSLPSSTPSLWRSGAAAASSVSNDAEPSWAADHDALVQVREAHSRFELRHKLHVAIQDFLRSYRAPGSPLHSAEPAGSASSSRGGGLPPHVAGLGKPAASTVNEPVLQAGAGAADRGKGAAAAAGAEVDDSAWLLSGEYLEGSSSGAEAVAALADALRRERESESASSWAARLTGAGAGAAAGAGVWPWAASSSPSFPASSAASPLSVADFEALLADFAHQMAPSAAAMSAAPGSSTLAGTSDAVSAKALAFGLPYTRPKVFFVSRTHSQLSQFVRELGKTRFGGGGRGGADDPVRLVPLGSRKNLCINDEVRALGSDVRMAERCNELLDATPSKVKQADGEEDEEDADGGAARPAKRPRTGSTKKKAKGCPYISNPVSAAAQTRYRHKLLAAAGGATGDDGASPCSSSSVALRDIEQAAALGAAMGTCPYYATRRALPLAEVVTLPYSMLLSSSTRASMGIDLRDSVVIIDEAHNLIDAINQTYAVVVTAPQAASALAQVRAYLARYHARLSPANLVLCTQFKDALAAVVKHLQAEAAAPRAPQGGLSNLRAPAAPPAPAAGSDALAAAAAKLAASAAPKPRASMYTPVEYLCQARLDHLNLHRLVSFVEDSGFINVLRGFAEAGLAGLVAADGGGAARGDDAAGGGGGLREGPTLMSAVTAMRAAFAFLRALCTADGDGRLVLDRGALGPGAEAPAAFPAPPQLRFVSLNCARGFESIVAEARAVILAGGTLAPVDSMVAQLLPSMPRSRVLTRAFSHVVDPGNVLGFAVKRGPTGATLDFRHAQRRLPAVMDELGCAIANLCAVVPHGLVVFLPSYQDEAALLEHWAKPRPASTSTTVPAAGVDAPPPPPSLLAQMQRRKPIFREPRSAADMDAVLQAYATAAVSPGGALLFSVVGGKMSEGINFADDLARGVVVVGLPYPNAGDPELQERMAYLDRSQGLGAGRAYYEDLCMKAVNQSIGRAIRHINDHAAVVLLDERYASGRIRAKLPGWINDRVQAAEGWGPVMAGMGRFYAGKKKPPAA